MVGWDGGSGGIGRRECQLCQWVRPSIFGSGCTQLMTGGKVIIQRLSEYRVTVDFDFSNWPMMMSNNPKLSRQSVSTWLHQLVRVKIYYGKIWFKKQTRVLEALMSVVFISIPLVIPPVNVGGAEISTRWLNSTSEIHHLGTMLLTLYEYKLVIWLEKKNPFVRHITLFYWQQEW